MVFVIGWMDYICIRDHRSYLVESGCKAMTTQIEPLDVRIVANTVTEGTKRPKENRASHRTAVLTAANPTFNIAGYDPARKCVSLNVLDNPVVLTESTGQASDQANTAVANAFGNPNGRLLPVSNGSEYYLETQDELWLSANTYPTRVGITIIREI